MSEHFVTWDDSFSVNFELIDNQHKELVKMTNILFAGCEKGSTAADVAFMGTIRKAVEYAQTHLNKKEKYMKLANYPDLDKHKQEHVDFVGTVVKAVKEFEDGKSEPLALALFLKEWLLNHIAQSDKKYSPYLAGIG
jgi:hemerythrin